MGIIIAKYPSGSVSSSVSGVCPNALQSLFKFGWQWTLLNQYELDKGFEMDDFCKKIIYEQLFF